MTDKACFGAGCFWHVQLAFSKLPGVQKTEVGFMGGNVPEASYEQVSTDTTGHAEACYIEFDPGKINYKDLLIAFWEMHDPTQKDRQGPDVGSQYRSVIFYYSDEQKEEAEKSKEVVEKSLGKKVATQIEKASDFIKAEDYHQDYLKKRGKNTC
tara:strand:+ start:14093 stop:14554 length:462 start_codon:yes stop_codon:yes gene_type:complete